MIMFRKTAIAATVLILLVTSLGGCLGKPPQTEPPQTGPERSQAEAPDPAISSEYTFAAYKEVPASVVPAVKPYQVEADLGNVTNKDMFRLSDQARSLLAKNGFVVVPTRDLKEFFWLYEENRYAPVPSFITTDSMLHNYHLFFSHLLRVIETERLIPELKALNRAMLEASEKQYAALQGTSWENAAKRNTGFFAVGSALLDNSVVMPAAVKDIVEKELDLIHGHEGIALSPLMNMGGAQDVVEGLKEDYSQYLQRGHYDRTEALTSYFRAMTWYGRMTFRLKSEDETRSAALVAHALSEDNALTAWKNIYEPTSFFVGKSDDISPLQIMDLLGSIYGGRPDLKTLASDQSRWAAFLDAAAKLEPAAINSMPIFDETIQPDRQREIKGVRFMGQRFTMDASIFQRLVYREVKEDSVGKSRMLPNGLDIPAALGSDEAYRILESKGETGYRNYPENMAKLRAYVSGLDRKTWTQNLYWSWLYSILPLIQEKPEGYPSFMRNAAWARKGLSTFLSSWAELKHDTILYAKPIYAEAGGGDLNVDDRGYVEPEPALYGRLAALARMTREGLEARGLLNATDAASLERLETLALSFKVISEKELSNTPLSDAEYDLIRAYGVQLEHFWLEALRDEGVEHKSQSFDHPAAVVADVATDPNGQVLEVGTGNIFEIYAVVPVDGSLRIAKGGVFSYYEFQWPIGDRLTDSKWREMLNTGKTPPLPEWTRSFIAQ